MPDVPDTFVDALAHELRLRGVPVLRSELRTWLQACGPLVTLDLSVSRWATAYREARPAWAEGAD
jgi:hypothetical protein